MVNVSKGTLISCDEAMVEFIKNLDKTRKLNGKFIIKQLDSTNVIVERSSVPMIKQHFEQLMDDQS